MKLQRLDKRLRDYDSLQMMHWHKLIKKKSLQQLILIWLIVI